ncbi:MAG: hypothetical protein JW384_00865 [Nitrosomonadaceae bacterium]|nr:hypothetical protein [Nitrosomonadaceae bacterium]
MTRVRCPQDRCIFWMNGWCDIDEIELAPVTLVCLTFEEMDAEIVAIASASDDLEWDDDESLFEDDLDESLYGYDDGEDEDEDDELIADDDDEWAR